MGNDINAIVRALEAQGFAVRRTKRGHYFVTLDGAPVTTIPGTPSDHRSLRNSIAAARRFGFVWPPPKR